MNEPVISKDLIEYLNKLFPKQDFTYKTDLRMLDYSYGQRSVVVFLENKYQEQNENILNSHSDF